MTKESFFRTNSPGNLAECWQHLYRTAPTDPDMGQCGAYENSGSPITINDIRFVGATKILLGYHN
jgi:hypothetical protein